jgi:hypothetical protein
MSSAVISEKKLQELRKECRAVLDLEGELKKTVLRFIYQNSPNQTRKNVGQVVLNDLLEKVAKHAGLIVANCGYSYNEIGDIVNAAHRLAQIRRDEGDIMFSLVIGECTEN